MSWQAAQRNWLKHYDPQVPPHLTYPRVPLYCLLEETAARHPANPCTNFFGKRFTYRQIKELSDRFAASAHLGVRKGDRVVLLLPNSPQFVIAYYGLLKAGAVIVPLNPLCAERELAFHLYDSGAETAITVPLFAKKVASLRGKTPLKRIVCQPPRGFSSLPAQPGSRRCRNGDCMRGSRSARRWWISKSCSSRHPQPTGSQSRSSRTTWPC